MSMDVLYNIASVMNESGLYQITDESFIMSELKAYAEGFDLPYRLIEDTITDAFVQTCSDSALKRFAMACGREAESYESSELRELIIYILSSFRETFSKDSVISALESYGYTGGVTEDFENERIIFDDVEFSPNPGAYKWLSEAAEMLLPAHLDYALNLPAYTWEQLDAADLTVTQIDVLDYRWNLMADTE